MGPRGSPAEALLDVVIPARNEAGRLERGLARLSGRLARLEASSNIIVVDNGSTDATAAIVRSWSGPVPVRLLQCARPGKGAAVRLGLLDTTAPYVGFCDAEPPTWRSWTTSSPCSVPGPR
ncbi:MAG: glycosyltransferase [Actinoallomurus sp.]